MKLALDAHLQQGIAYRQGVSETNYETFVREVQNLAKGLESIPSFRTIRGSDKEHYTSENNPQVFQYPWEVELPASRALPSSSRTRQTPVQYGRDGDVQMANINSLQSQIQAQTQAILAATKGGDAIDSGGKDRRNDTRPFPPEASRAERNRRIDNNRCERCNRTPSHRWGDCIYQNFRKNPTPRGYSSSRRSGVNGMAKESSTNNFASDSENS